MALERSTFLGISSGDAGTAITLAWAWSSEGEYGRRKMSTGEEIRPVWM
jgi:hypothetical protein